MNLKKSIEAIFTNNTDYTNPSQAVNQASSLKALSEDLYTDSRRFIYELLQNADDSSQNNETVEVWIKNFDDHLVVAHSGTSFSIRDVQGICNVNNGTKRSDLTKTGYKGIGFKAVFGQSDKVIIFTKGEYFRFDSSYSFKWKWEESQLEWESDNEREFQFPWQIIPIYTMKEEVSQQINQFLKDIDANVATIIKLRNWEETSQAIQKISQNSNMFLFLKNISKINFDMEEKVVIEINRLEHSRITLKEDNCSKSDWLINTINLEVPSEVKLALKGEQNTPEKLLNTDIIELSLAAKVGSKGIVQLSSQERLLYSYLPTDEIKYSLPVLVNTSFLTTANRESLHADSKWNQWLFKTIAVELFKWISILVNTEFNFQAYQLIPNKTFSDKLGESFNDGINSAIKNVPFIVSREGELIKIEDAIVDFTYLSEKDFVGEEAIRQFLSINEILELGSSKRFVKNNDFFSNFKRLGASCFEWQDVKAFLLSTHFIKRHTPAYNIELIKHLKKICISEKVRNVSKEELMNLPFILDHRGCINYPHKVCFPTSDDKNWNNKESELSFLHFELQSWLIDDLESRQWLESLGVEEKTDITYITQNILPIIESYVTHQNALTTIKDLYSLHKKGDLPENLLRKLSSIKLLTQKGTLCSAKDCYLSNYYKPRLEIEEIIETDIFVSKLYCTDILEKDEWKRFFKFLGVQEGISAIQYNNKTFKTDLITAGFCIDYFEKEDKKFMPFRTTFTADVFSNMVIMSYIQFTENNSEFAYKFWLDYLENYSPEIVKSPAVAYWGYDGRQGRREGDEVENFVTWFVKNKQCIPTLSGECEVSSSVFLNTEELKSIADKYLCIFNGPELSSDWKSFFNFRTSLELSDYLEVLSKISLDIDSKGNIKNSNYERIQAIYSILLSQCTNWSDVEIAKIKEWSVTGLLLNTNYQFSKCDILKCFLDGNEIIFQEQYCFILLSAENKKNPNLEIFLSYFKIGLLRQSEFELVQTEEEICLDLKTNLIAIRPYFRAWIENEICDENTITSLKNLKYKIEDLKIFQAEELKITYKKIDFTKCVNIHFNGTNLYVTKPWFANSVLLKLSEVICRYFKLLGHDRKLDFLLRSTNDEIQKYFIQEEIELPKLDVDVRDSFGVEAISKEINSFADIENAITKKNISTEFYHLSIPDFNRLQYIEGLIPRAVSNIIEHLKLLSEYDCTNIYKIASSIIGGVTKNGNDITIVARPSDGDEVRIYYTSEFDVLEYVDAEFWYEDGINTPKQLTFGKLLNETGINRIPVKNINIRNLEIGAVLNNPKSEILEFNAVPYVPQKIARIISSFANTNGGDLIFGIKEGSPNVVDVIGLSDDFQVVNTTKKAISLLSPIPIVTYDKIVIGDKPIFVIKTNKSDKDILLDKQKYIREGANTVLINTHTDKKKEISIPKYAKTIAIIIAIEEYAPRKDNQVAEVKYAIKDALKMKELLINSMNVNESDIHMITNEQALKNNLEYDFQSLFYSLEEEDRLIFYYVGHGFHNGITNYLSTYDMHPSNIVETSISLRKILLDPLHKSKCKNALVFIDACAQSFQDENSRNQFTDINDEELKIFINNFPYYAIFLSCQPGQSSYSCDNLNNGIWTHHLVKAIGGQVPEVIYCNKYIVDRLLSDYLSKAVSQYTKEQLQYSQNPKAIIDSNYGNVIAEIKENN